jgi:predicted transposase/invertase (TIGR01784 family)
MADYLKKQSSEVENMLMTEFNIDIAKEVWMEEAREDGEARGKLATARKMHRRGRPLNEIAEDTDLPLETLKTELGIADSPAYP